MVRSTAYPPLNTLQGTQLHLADDAKLTLGNTSGSPNVSLLYETADANANAILLSLPSGGAIDVPVFAVGDGLEAQDLGMFDGLTETLLAAIDADRDSYVGLFFSADDVAVLRMRMGAAGTVRNHTIPDVASDTIVLLGATQTLTAKTLTTPTIGDMTNSGHDHSNAAGGGAVVSASATVSGIAELATVAELETGTDAGRVITPDVLAGSNLGERVVTIEVFSMPDSTDAATGDGKAFWRVPASLTGMNLVAVAAAVRTAGTTNTLDIQINNVTQGADMLTTVITIDSAETDSSTAATPAVIDADNDDVTTGDQIRIDVDAIHTTASKGLLVELTFRLP